MNKLHGMMAITPPVVADRVLWSGMIEAALKGGARILQLRLKPATPMEVMLQARRVLELTRHYGIPLIIDDFPEVAAEVGADGVHLGKDDASVSEVRRKYGKKLIIGASAYCDPELAVDLQRQGADYLGISTPFVSSTKKSAPSCPMSVVGRVKQSVSIPVFLVGGITLDNIDQVQGSGADGFAVSWALFGAGDPQENAQKFVEAWNG